MVVVRPGIVSISTGIRVITRAHVYTVSNPRSAPIWPRRRTVTVSDVTQCFQLLSSFLDLGRFFHIMLVSGDTGQSAAGLSRGGRGRCRTNWEGLPAVVCLS